MKQFNTTLNGYDKTEVNAFVNEVTREYENVLDKLKSREIELKALKDRLEYYKNLESTLNTAVLVAEDSSNQIKKIAKEEAKLIIDQAKKNASHIINDALIKAEKTEIEADQLRRSLKIYKSRIKATIEEQLTMVDDVDNITE
ncbi:MAG: DivIVA domain-containing protein [Firmicutes bacterium]|nr:DivIVA domain-containing protein [Bacillota bacterium]